VCVCAPYYKARERSLLRKIEQCRNEGSSTCRQLRRRKRDNDVDPVVVCCLIWTKFRREFGAAIFQGSLYLNM
jgi:hypothetical protein